MSLRVAGSSLGLTGWSGLTATNVLYAASATTVGQDGTFTFNGTALSVPELTLGALSTIHFTGLTANALLYSDGTDLTQDATNLTYLATGSISGGPRFTIGSGGGASAGWHLGNDLAAGYGGIWSTSVTPSTTNYTLAGNADHTYLQAPTGTLNLVVNNSTVVQIGATAMSVAGYIQGNEMTAPAGTANAFRIFAQDNGAGKTQLMVIFGSGVAQQIAIET